MSRVPTITITVAGASGSGKSTIARIIRKALMEHELDARHDVGPDGPITDYEHRIEVLRPKAVISLVEVNLARSPKENQL